MANEAKILFFRALDDSFRRTRQPYLHEVMERWLEIVDEARRQHQEDRPAAA